MIDSYQGKTAVITGAGSGIGRALALSLAARGASLALSDVDQAGLEQTAEAAHVKGAEVYTELVDVSSKDAVYAHADAVVEQFGAADLVINNAGVSLLQTVLEMEYEDFEWVMDINFWGVVYGTKAFLPMMLRRGTGALVNISSIFGIVGVPTQSAYNASKFAVRGFTEALRQEVAGRNVLISCVHPGGIQTNIVRKGRIYDNATPGGSADKLKRDFDTKLARTTAPEAADTILEGVLRGEQRILIGQDAKVMDVVQRVLPTHYDRALERIRKGLKK